MGDAPSDLPSEERRYRITDLLVLQRSRTAEEVVIWEGLETGSLADRQASALGRIVVNIVVSILRDVRCHRCGGFPPQLNSKSVGES